MSLPTEQQNQAQTKNISLTFIFLFIWNQFILALPARQQSAAFVAKSGTEKKCKVFSVLGAFLFLRRSAWASFILSFTISRISTVQLSWKLSEGPHLQGITMKYSNCMWHNNFVSLSQLVSAGYCFPLLIPSHWLVATDLTCPVWAVASPSLLTHLSSSAAISRISHIHQRWKGPPEDPLVSQHEKRECMVT